MIKACDLAKSSVVDIGGTPHVVEQIVMQTPSARGGSTLYKVRFRNAVTRQKVDQTFRGEDKLAETDLEKREAQYLYRTGDVFTFMDLGDYSQFEMTAAELGDDAIAYLVEDMEGIRALVSGGRTIGIELPDVVEMSIAECEPSIRGASATSRAKPATMQTGLTVLVPEYVAPGERIRVDTRTGGFISRA